MRDVSDKGSTSSGSHSDHEDESEEMGRDNLFTTLYSHVYFTSMNAIQNYLDFNTDILMGMNILDSDKAQSFDPKMRLGAFLDKTAVQRTQLSKYFKALSSSVQCLKLFLNSKVTVELIRDQDYKSNTMIRSLS